jgi:hypothetical protein
MVGGGYEGTPVVRLVLLLPRAVRGALAGAFIVLCLALGTVKDCPNCLLARGMARCNVKELLSGLWALVSQLMDQGLVGGPR